MSDFVLTATVRADAKQFRRELGAAEQTTKRLGRSAGAVKPGFRGVGGEAERTRRKIRQLSGSSDKLRGSFGGLRTVVAALGLGLVTRGIVRANAEFQRLTAALETVAGGAAIAKREMAWMDEFSTETPFQLEEIIGGFIKLTARGLSPTKRVMTSLGDTASAMGKSLDQMIEATADAVTGETERLKEFGIKASIAGEKVEFTYRGVTAEVENTNEAIQAYLVKLGETYNVGAMAKQIDTLGGAFSNLGVATSRWSRALGEGGFNQTLQDMSEGLANTLNASHDTAGALGKDLATALEVAGGGAGALAKALSVTGPWLFRLGGLFLVARGSTLAYSVAIDRAKRAHTRLRTAVRASATAQRLFGRSLTLLGGPAGVIIAGGAGLALLANNFLAVKKAADDVSFVEFNKAVGGLQGIKGQVSSTDNEALTAAEEELRRVEENLSEAEEIVRKWEVDVKTNPALAGGGMRLARATEATRNIDIFTEQIKVLTEEKAGAEAAIAKLAEKKQAQDSKKAKEILANLSAEIDYQRRLNAVLGDGVEVRRRIEAAIAKDKAIKGAGSNVTDEQKRAIEGQYAALARVKGAAADWEATQNNLKEANERHKESVEDIKQKLQGYAPVYDRLSSEAKKWKQESLTGLDATAFGYERFSKRVDDVYGHMLADARQRDLESSTKWQDGIIRGLDRVSKDARDMATQTERAVIRLGGGMEDAFLDFATGAKSGSDAFKSFADSVIRDIMRIAIRQSILGELSKSLGTAIGGVFGGGTPEVGTPEWHQLRLNAAKGRVFGRSGEEITKFAAGGVVYSPTMFRHAKGVGMMGEAGAEAILPLGRGPGGKLGVRALGSGRGGGGGELNISMPAISMPAININIDAKGAEKGVEELVAAKVAEQLPMVLRTATSQALDAVATAVNKGGNFARMMGRR